MATYMAKQFVGVFDGTKIPADKADGRQAGATKGITIASKDNVNALVATDKIYIGKLRTGEMLTDIKAVTDTSLATATISIGTLALPNKYVASATLTVINVPTSLGPLASAVDAGPVAAEEDLYATIAVAGIAAAVKAAFMLERSFIH